MNHPRTRKEITRTQRKILRMLGEGHSLISAAATLEISWQTAKTQLHEARLRTGKNTYALVAAVAVEDALAIPPGSTS